MIRISLIEDDAKTRNAWEVLLNGTPGFCCVSTHPTAEHALKKLPADKIDLVVVDLGLPKMSGIEVIRLLKARHNSLHFCVYTINEDSDKIYQSLKAGASGYVLKKTAPAIILGQFSELMAGGSPMSMVIARKVTQFFNGNTNASKDTDGLSDRQREVLHLLSQGETNKEIAESLGISIHTVGQHIKNIYDLLEVHSRAEATAKYLGRK